MLPVLVLATIITAAPAPGDDTAEFLKKDNWKGLDGYWTVDSEKKTITGHTEKDPKFNTFFCTQQEYGDLELSFKVRLKDGVGNSGVQVRSRLIDKDKFIVAGPQADIGA